MINGGILYEKGTFYVGIVAKENYRKANKLVEKFAFLEEK